MSDDKIALGRHLFYDARLSADGTVACASCHDQALAFTDGRQVAQGLGGEGQRNTPGLGNVGYMPVLTWGNPQIESLELHALIPMFGTDPVEMGGSGQEAAIFDRLAGDPYYAAAFAAAFPDRGGDISLFTITRALAAFQRSLITARSAYDRFKYQGDATALSPAALRGEGLFFGERLECYHCHGGFNFTDTLKTSRSAFAETGFHNTGLYNLDGAGAVPRGSEGIAALTLRPHDLGRFRTPSLRNVAVTAPYMHDGSIATLDGVIAHYAAGGRTIAEGPNAEIGADSPLKDPLVAGFAISPSETADIIAFLESLTDREFLTDPAFADPWPNGHPAMLHRKMPQITPVTSKETP